MTPTAQFRIADTFADSLARLTGGEQRAAKTAAFDLQLNPSAPGLSFHRIKRARDRNFWSVRVNRDIRIIAHRSGQSLLLCYVGHHDAAYQWAARRKLETHPRTGAAQMVEVRERVQEVAAPGYAAGVSPRPPLFVGRTESDLLGYGVPAEWVDDVLALTEEDALLELAGHLPAEAGEALLVLATGGTPARPQEAEGADPFSHPDAQRRFRLMANAEELERALEYPWEKWTVFLHPTQRQVVERDYNGPCRVSGTAGTGKTVVALHRAAFLARENPAARILLTTFSDPLAAALRTKLGRLLHNAPRLLERVEVATLDTVCARLFRARFGAPKIAADAQVREILAARAEAGGFRPRFLVSEWESVVDAWGLADWEAYRDVRRLGRRTRLPVERRAVLWKIFEQLKAELRARGLVTRSEMFRMLARNLEEHGNPPFDFAVVDEAQDVGVAPLRFLAALRGGRPNGLFFAGDLGQRIFQTPFSWKALGVDVRGRSRTLRLNYRTSHQIRTQADRLLGPEVADVDGNAEDRRGTVSAFNGAPPAIRRFDTEAEERKAVGAWLRGRREAGVGANEMGVFVRSEKELERARKAVRGADVPLRVLDEGAGGETGGVSISTMHLAKGLEFRAVVVMACDDEVLPLQERIENVGDDADLKEVYDTERHLLYVSCTRARDSLMVTGVRPASEFLDDLAMDA